MLLKLFSRTKKPKNEINSQKPHRTRKNTIKRSRMYPSGLTRTVSRPNRNAWFAQDGSSTRLRTARFTFGTEVIYVGVDLL